VLDTQLRLPVTSRLVATARDVPVWVATAAAPDDPRRAELAEQGVEFLACDAHDGRIALPELLEDIAARGLSSPYSSRAAPRLRAFLAEGLVDRLILLTGEGSIDGEAVNAPVTRTTVPGLSGRSLP
jgi:diaminohydroxyphosphoribosylaminopyrimidine deaminase/5-amino-6-(5-phosphoribosylamino)uracil reductase